MCSGVVHVVLGPLQQESKCIFEMGIEHRVFKSAVPTNKKTNLLFLFSPVATANHHVLHIFPSHNNLLHALDIWNLNNFVIFYDEKKKNQTTLLKKHPYCII